MSDNGETDMTEPTTQTPEMNVRQYFELTFPKYEYARNDYADILSEMELHSNCGDECRKIIDHAFAWQSMADARPDDYVESTIDAMLDITVHTCVVYIRG